MARKPDQTVILRPAIIPGDGTIHLVLKGGQHAIIDDTAAHREWALTRNWQLTGQQASTSEIVARPDGGRIKRHKTLAEYVCPTHYIRPVNADWLDLRWSNIVCVNPRPKIRAPRGLGLIRPAPSDRAEEIAIQELLAPAPAPAHQRNTSEPILQDDTRYVSASELPTEALLEELRRRRAAVEAQLITQRELVGELQDLLDSAIQQRDATLAVLDSLPTL